jgi:hypothetical protein
LHDDRTVGWESWSERVARPGAPSTRAGVVVCAVRSGPGATTTRDERDHDGCQHRDDDDHGRDFVETKPRSAGPDQPDTGFNGPAACRANPQTTAATTAITARTRTGTARRIPLP